MPPISQPETPRRDWPVGAASRSGGRYIDIRGHRFGHWVALAPCGRSDKQVEWKCICDCGSLRNVKSYSLRRGISRSCGCESRSLHWSGRRRKTVGDRYKTTSGYAYIYMPDHENADSAGRVLEHRFVMSEHLNRPLRGDEEVHHKNGIKDDNRIGNLELWTRSHPRGQRVIDKLSWAKEILDLYGGTVAVKEVSNASYP